MAGFYCSVCNRVYLANTTNGLCAECPEPLYDLSTPEGRVQARTAEVDERARARNDAIMPSVLAAVVGGGAAFVAAAAVLDSRWSRNDWGLRLAQLAGVLGAALAAALAWRFKLRHAKSRLPALPVEETANLCAACNSAELDPVAAKVYQCRTCGYQGGEGLAAWIWQRELDAAQKLPGPERRKQAVLALREVQTTLLALAGTLREPMERFHPEGDRRRQEHYLTRDGVLATIGSDLALAQAALCRAAILSDRSYLNIDLHESLSQVLRVLEGPRERHRKVPAEASRFVENCARFALRSATEIMSEPPPA